MGNDETVRLCLSQGEIEHMLVTIPKRVCDKIAEIAQRYPMGFGENRGLDLKKQAYKELEEDGWIPPTIKR